MFIKLLLSLFSVSNIVYEPRKWNRHKIIVTHDSYAYAMNNLTDSDNMTVKYYNEVGFRCDKNIVNDNYCEYIEEKMFCDYPDIKYSNYDDKCEDNYYKIGFAVTDNKEHYQFYRKDSNLKGFWSLKRYNVIRFDSSMSFIDNPEMAFKDYRSFWGLHYKNWCGYYCVPFNENQKISKKVC